MNYIGKNIRKLRAHTEMSQEHLAKLLECSSRTVVLWEAGTAKPSLNKLIAMRDIFEVSLDKLICEELKFSII